MEWKHPGGKFRRLGSASCSEQELLAIILGSGTKGRSSLQVSEEILESHGNLYNLMGVSLKDLMKIKGLKEVKATKIAAVFEIARRIVKHLERN